MYAEIEPLLMIRPAGKAKRELDFAGEGAVAAAEIGSKRAPGVGLMPGVSHSIGGLIMDGVWSVSMVRPKFGAMRATAVV